MVLWEAGILLGVGCAAGVINAVAGGGTILTFPVLIGLGLPGVVANATSTFALVAGTVGSAWGYRSHFGAVRAWLGSFGAASVLGGWLGAWLLTVTPADAFDVMIPFLLLSATSIFALQNFSESWYAGKKQQSVGRVWGLAAQLAVGIYGGYFGAGIGILMLAILGCLGFRDIHQMNCLKTYLAMAINLVAGFYFIIVGLVAWPEALVLTSGAMAGYFVGAHWSQKIPQKFVRLLITGISFFLTGFFFFR